MRNFMAINKRNIGLYFKDFSAVFFSLLSMLIVIFLMVFFLGDVTNSEIMNILKLIPGRGGEEDAKLCENIVFLWTCAGIITINAATVTHSFYSNIGIRTGICLQFMDYRRDNERVHFDRYRDHRCDQRR